MKKLTINKIDVLSVGKLLGVMYAAIGLIIGFFITIFSIFASAISGSGSMALFGAGSIIIMPIMYGIMGFISGVLMAFLYNLFAGLIGGIKIETKS